MTYAITCQQTHLNQCDQYKRKFITNLNHHLIQIILNANIRFLVIDVVK